MPLKPIPGGPEPDYPDMDQFAKERRRFLKSLGLVAGVVLAGQVLPGCGKEVPPRPSGTPAPPTEPPPQPVQPGPPEHLPGLIAEPPPVEHPEQLSGKMRAPEPPEKLRGEVVEPEPEPPVKEGEEPPRDR